MSQVTEELTASIWSTWAGLGRTTERVSAGIATYDIEGAPSGSRMYVRAKCKQPYFLQVIRDYRPECAVEGPPFADPNLRLKVLI